MRLVGSTGRAAWRQSRTASHGPLRPASWPHWWPQVSGRLSSVHPFKITFCHPFFLRGGGSSSLLSVTKKRLKLYSDKKHHVKDQQSTEQFPLLHFYRCWKEQVFSELALFERFTFPRLSWQLPAPSTNYLPCPSVIRGLLWRAAGLHRDLKWQMISPNE